MEYADILAPLDIELQKVGSLNGSMAVVVVPEKYAEKAMTCKRDVDTVVRMKEYLVLGIFGVQADEASARFLSIPKGIAVFPQDGHDIQNLFFEALERLRFMGTSTWVKRLWESIKETRTHDTRDDPESRFISATFYQFLQFMISHPNELHKVFSGQDMAELSWVKDYIPSGFFSRDHALESVSEEQVADLFQQWPYQEKMEAKLEKGKRTLRKFRNIEHLFTLPSISQEIIDLAGDSAMAAGKMARIIEKDPVLTSKILKVVNSAFYGFRRQVDSVEQSVFILGNEEVVNLAFSIAIHKILETISPEKARKLWEHSLEVAQLAQWLGPIMGCMARQRLYTVGLLHDFGKIVFLQRGYYTGGIDGPSSMEDLAAEETDSGISHAEMGAYVAERWNLPEAIVDALIGHHLPSKAKDMSLAVTVHVSDIIAHCGQIDLGKVNNSAIDYLSDKKGPALSQENVLEMAAEIKRRVSILLDE
ncbi:MAG TPA: HDOD domain-containing protein [Deltaproteobacteria bacterium]|jgi:HD-like signal output (HDOD) protein|nr:HDOD domain-containing protein [Deltaproteobacteria bacterium]HOI06401.1 HDOD domain-containing protein [Deltaproteobacteria bacterium]